MAEEISKDIAALEKLKFIKHYVQNYYIYYYSFVE